MSVHISFAYDNNKQLVNIKDEINSDVYCIECGEKLIARRGDIREHHFAHYGNSTCAGGGRETIIHILAKEIIKDNKKVFVNALTNYGLQEFERLEFSEVMLEKKIEDIKPDIIGIDKNGTQYFIEIAVTHFCDQEKIEKIKKLNIACIEIDLSSYLYNELPMEYIKESLESLLLYKNFMLSKYLFDPTEKDKYKKYIEDETKNIVSESNTIRSLIFKHRYRQSYFFNTTTKEILFIDSTWDQLNTYNGRYWYSKKYSIEDGYLKLIDNNEEVVSPNEKIWVFLSRNRDRDLYDKITLLYKYYYNKEE